MFIAASVADDPPWKKPYGITTVVTVVHIIRKITPFVCLGGGRSVLQYTSSVDLQTFSTESGHIVICTTLLFSRFGLNPFTVGDIK